MVQEAVEEVVEDSQPASSTSTEQVVPDHGFMGGWIRRSAGRCHLWGTCLTIRGSTDLDTRMFFGNQDFRPKVGGLLR